MCTSSDFMCFEMNSLTVITAFFAFLYLGTPSVLLLIGTIYCLSSTVFADSFFLPYIFMTVQNGAHLVFLWSLTSLCFLLGCLCLAILFGDFYFPFLGSHLLKYFLECDIVDFFQPS